MNAAGPKGHTESLDEGCPCMLDFQFRGRRRPRVVDFRSRASTFSHTWQAPIAQLERRGEMEHAFALGVKLYLHIRLILIDLGCHDIGRGVHRTP